MAPSSMAASAVFAANPAEQPQLRRLGDRLTELEARHEAVRLVSPDGTEIPFPASAVRVLLSVIEAMSRGASIALVTQGKELSTTQAAELLHVSRPFLVRRLLGKEIPFEKVGNHKRVRLDDVIEFPER